MLGSLVLLISASAIFAIAIALPAGIQKPVLQATSVVAIICSIISIGCSLLLIRSNQHHTEAHASEAVDFLENAFQSKYGLQPLAIIFSLPWSCFLWAFTSVAASAVVLTFSVGSFFIQFFLWIFMVFIALGAYMVIVFLRTGANSVTPLRWRLIVPMAFALPGRAWGLVGRAADASGSIVRGWVARYRIPRGFVRVSTNDDNSDA